MYNLNCFQRPKDYNTHNAQGVAQPAGCLVGETSKGTNTAQRGSKVGHLVALGITGCSRGCISTKEGSGRDAVQVVVLRRISGSVEKSKDRPLTTYGLLNDFFNFWEGYGSDFSSPSLLNQAICKVQYGYLIIHIKLLRRNSFTLNII